MYTQNSALDACSSLLIDCWYERYCSCLTVLGNASSSVRGYCRVVGFRSFIICSLKDRRCCGMDRSVQQNLRITQQFAKYFHCVVFLSIYLYNLGMTKEDAIKLAGSPSELARMLGCSRQAVNNWVKLPQGRLWQLKVLRPEWFR